MTTTSLFLSLITIIFACALLKKREYIQSYKNNIFAFNLPQTSINTLVEDRRIKTGNSFENEQEFVEKYPVVKTGRKKQHDWEVSIKLNIDTVTTIKNIATVKWNINFNSYKGKLFNLTNKETEEIRIAMENFQNCQSCCQNNTLETNNNFSSQILTGNFDRLKQGLKEMAAIIHNDLKMKIKLLYEDKLFKGEFLEIANKSPTKTNHEQISDIPFAILICFSNRKIDMLLCGILTLGKIDFSEAENCLRTMSEICGYFLLKSSVIKQLNNQLTMKKLNNYSDELNQVWNEEWDFLKTLLN